MGKILYITNTVRPDISFMAGVLGGYAAKPTTHHRHGAMQVLKCMLGAKDLGLIWELSENSCEFVGTSTRTTQVMFPRGDPLQGVFSLVGVQPLDGSASCNAPQHSLQLSLSSMLCAEGFKRLSPFKSFPVILVISLGR